MLVRTSLPFSIIKTRCKSIMVEIRCAMVMTVMLTHRVARVSFSTAVVCGSTFAVHSSKHKTCKREMVIQKGLRCRKQTGLTIKNHSLYFPMSKSENIWRDDDVSLVQTFG